MKSNKTVLTIAAMAILALAVSAQAEILFYESFDYTGGSVVAGNGTPVGGVGTWVQSSGPQMVIAPPNDPYSQLDDFTGLPAGVPGAGGSYAAGSNHNENRLAIGLDASVTGTFIDGSITWMSFVAINAQNHLHHKPNMAIGQGELLNDRAMVAEGQAIGGGAHSTDSNRLEHASYWYDADSSGTAERYSSGQVLVDYQNQELIVMKIEWGAANDKVSVLNFDMKDAADWALITEDAFNAGAVSITSTVNLDQSTFDTLSMHSSRSSYDEIRIGTTFADILTGTSLIDLGEDPKNGSTVGIDRTDPLSWILPDPNDLVNGTVRCVVWFTDNYPEAGLFGGDPNFTNYATKIVGDPNPEAVQSVAIPVTLEKLKTYYWRIDTYDDSADEPQPVIGPVFNFNTNNQTPGVELGEDIITWLTEGSAIVPLTGVITDPDGPDVPVLQWYIDDVLVEGATAENIDVTLTETGDYVVRLTAFDGLDTGEDTVAITVYSDSCAAALGQGATLLQTDFNEDCVTDFADFAEFASEWLESVAL